MRIGFIGAGKVGCTLGKYFVVNNAELSGYFSARRESAEEAAEFTHTRYYTQLEDIVRDSDALFLTCPDGAIEDVWNSLKRYTLKGKCICHCSGALSSAVFSEKDRTGAYGYSIHPLFAVNSKWNSYREISKAYFTIEGDKKYLDLWKSFFEDMGNPVKVISPDNKILYHSAAVFVSNLVCGLFSEGIELMKGCGFKEDEAVKALGPMLVNNAAALAGKGPKEALTGPLERADVRTMEKHLEVLDGPERQIYLALSEVLIRTAQEKNPERDYGSIKKLIAENKAEDAERN